VQGSLNQKPVESAQAVSSNARLNFGSNVSFLDQIQLQYRQCAYLRLCYGEAG